jgi:hypothetical protein
MDDKNIKNRGLKDKLVLDAESYDTLLNMLNGDHEDKVVAFECLNNVDQKKSLVYTLFLRKYGNAQHSMWKDNCPKVLHYHGSLGFEPTNNIIKHASILEIIKTQPNKEENLNFFLVDFSKFLKEGLEKAFEFVYDLEFTLKFIKIKDDEKQK